MAHTHHGQPSAPPVAPRRAHIVRRGDDERVDDWFWLRDRDDPAVLAHLAAENAFAEAGLAHLQADREQIFEEIRSRVRETDASAPVRRGDWEYFTRTVAGFEYAWHCRRPAGTPGIPDPDSEPGSAPGEVVILDENVVATGHAYFALRGMAVSPDQRLLAYATDVTGGERSTLHLRDLSTAEDLADEVPDLYYGLAWANDNNTVFYVRPDATMRPWQVWRHTLGTPAAADALVIQEDDERYSVGLDRARTGHYLIVEIASKLTSEVHLIDADDPTGSPRVVAPRRHGIEYHVEHHHDPERGDRLFVLTNDAGAQNFKVRATPWTTVRGDAGRSEGMSEGMPGGVGPPLADADVDDADLSTWPEVIAHRDDVRLGALDAFSDHLVVSERNAGLEMIEVFRLDGSAETPLGPGRLLEGPEAVASMWVGSNPEFATSVLRHRYTSLVTPVTDLDYDLESGEASVVKRQAVAGYDPADYETFRDWATAGDGTLVPISMVRRRNLATPGPVLLYGYGAYEISIDPMFSISRVSLLERGVTYAIAHVRGGGELGRHWYEGGKLDRKRTSFTDFVAVAEHLVDGGLTSPHQLVARGGSAGGLLMGAVANLRPDLFSAIVAEVPFVDCLTTMLDPSLPLTANEWEEWGDPITDDRIYEYMKSYSPYDNVQPRPYPALLVTAGLNDPRVQYWEPAKWVAKLRATATGSAPVYLRTELGAGHHGPSGRYGSWREEAGVLAFILDRLGPA